MSKDSKKRSISCFVLTVSDTRTPKTDESGRLMIEQLEGEGHRLVGYAVVRDDAKEVRDTIRKAVAGVRPAAILVSGGTGISRRDSTFEAIDALLERRIPGFGEIFRFLSYQEIGSRALLSRATAGLFKGVVIFSVPGSPKAVRLALSKLILPELSHAVVEAAKES